MKKCFYFLPLLVHFGMLGQASQSSFDTISKPLLSTNKTSLLNNVDMVFNMRFANDNLFEDGKFKESEFSNNQFRLEILGKVHDRVSFRFRDRFTKDTNPGSRDNISHSMDMAYIGVDVTNSTQLFIGKLNADWGGYEFYLNPIDILQYNDILEYSDNYLSGVGVKQQVSKNHSFGLQILNSRSSNMEDIYGLSLPEGIEKSKTPMAVVTNWKGSFWNGKFETIYSYSYFSEANKRGMNFYSLGNKFQDKRWTVMYDFKYSNEGIDRNGTVSRMTAANSDFVQQGASYLENWMKVDYKVADKFTLSMVLMNNNTYAKNLVSENSGTNHLRSSYGVIPSVEYMPFKDLNIKFFASYVGRYYKYSSFAKEALGQTDYNTGRISIGFIAPLTVL